MELAAAFASGKQLKIKEEVHYTPHGCKLRLRGLHLSLQDDGSISSRSLLGPIYLFSVVKRECR